MIRNNLKPYLEIAEKAALQAGVVLKEHFGKVSPSMISEKAKNDFVTDVDKKSETIIKNLIRSHFNDHDILAEESAPEKHSSPFRWIIDPLDGTLNYIHGLPSFAISIALEIEGELAVGLIYEPLRDIVYAAMKDKGAFKNGRRMLVSGNGVLSSSLIATGFPFRIKDVIDTYLTAFRGLFMRSTGIRRCGSACLDLAYTADGVFGGFFEIGLSPWDVAAGALIVKEAGGVITDFTGGNLFLKSGNVIAGSGSVHAEMLEIIQKVFQQPCSTSTPATV